MIKNVKEFIDYRSTCPVCGKNLSLAFKGKDRKIVKYEGNRVLIKKNMFTLTKQKFFSFIYSIDMYDNTFYVDFLSSKEEILETHIPISYIQNFNKYNKSGTGIFYRFCSSCSQYGYATDYFGVDMKSSKINNFYIKSEYISIYKKVDDNYRVYRMTNQYDKGESIIDWFSTEDVDWFLHLKTKLTMGCDSIHLLDDSMFKLPIQNIDNFNETIDRIDKLIIFL